MLENLQKVLSRIESIKSRASVLNRANFFNDPFKNKKSDFQSAVKKSIENEGIGKTREIEKKISSASKEVNEKTQNPLSKKSKADNPFKGSSYDVGSIVSVLEKINEKNILSDTGISITKSNKTPDKSDRIKELISAAVKKNAGKFNLEPELIMAVIQTESSGNPLAVSSAGAQGLMQLMPGTAGELNVKKPFDVNENVRGGTEYLAMMLGRFGSVDKALAAYNAGPGNVEKYNGIPPFSETKRYVEKVKKAYESIKKQGF